MIVRQREKTSAHAEQIRKLQQESMQLIRVKVQTQARLDEIVKEIKHIEEMMKK